MPYNTLISNQTDGLRRGLMTKITYEEWTKENPIDLDNYDDDEEDGMINEMHYQLYLWECMKENE